MTLTTLDIIKGLFSLILMFISLIIGITIASRYFKLKQKTFLFVGLAWICINEPWLSSAISFIVGLVTGEDLTSELYTIMGMVFIIIVSVLL